LGFKHNLEFIQVIDDNGNMNANAGKFQGLSKEEARERVVAELEEKGYLVKAEDYENSVGHCYRCHTIIEPHVSTQWFVKVGPLAKAAHDAVPGQTRFYPESWTKTYYNWLDNIRDWCISRQIWWGHRIPAWTCACGALVVSEEEPGACPKCGSEELTQDPDVLDTWFSSALWPFSTMGWPEKTGELDVFYPTSVLSTGFDIIFFWVARMMMLGIHFMGKAPFRDVYIHALVRNADGKKMSKSAGNVINPLEMIDRYGTDSLRFTLASMAAMGRDIKMSEERVEGYRHFVNKVWNAARFALMNMPEDGAPVEMAELAKLEGVHHQWILHRLEEVKEANKAAVAAYQFNEAAQNLYKFVWGELCDWYLELIKPDMYAGGKAQAGARFVLLTALRETMLLLHPLMPFVSAEIWAALPQANGEAEAARDIATVLYPPARPECVRPEAAERMEMLQAAIVAVRTIRAELNIAPSIKLKVIIRPQDAKAAALLEQQRSMISVLARLEDLVIDPSAESPRLAAAQVAEGNEVIVLLEGAVDFEAERVRLDKELAKLEKERAMLENKLGNRNYVEKAPAELVERDKGRVYELKDAEEKLKSVRAKFGV
jgi:valyl-tRNA synthetase